MHSRRSVSRVMIPAMTLAAAICSGAVFAHDNNPSDDSQVRIQGEPVVTHDGWSRTGIRDEREQLSQDVSYADLNLATSSGARELKTRVREAASNICWKLGDYDDSNLGAGALENQATCVTGALQDAMPKVDKAIARSRG